MVPICDIEHSTAFRYLCGEGAEYIGLFSDLDKVIQVKSVSDSSVKKW